MTDRTPGLIIVSGPPATGKTTVANELAQRLHLPCLGKDAIKEALFDELGWTDRDWSRRLGAAAIRVLLTLAETYLRAGCSSVLDSNFRPEVATADFLAIQRRTPFAAIQVLCECDGPVLVERFGRRGGSIERHPGHGDANNLAEFAPELMKGRYEPLGLDGPIFHLDTTDFDPVTWRQALDQVCATFTRGEFESA